MRFFRSKKVKFLAMLLVVAIMGGVIYSNGIRKSSKADKTSSAKEVLTNKEESDENNAKCLKYIKSIKERINCKETVTTVEQLEDILNEYNVYSISEAEKNNIIAITDTEVLLKQLGNECKIGFQELNEILEDDTVVPDEKLSSIDGDIINRKDILEDNIILSTDMRYEQKKYNLQNGAAIVIESIDSVEGNDIITRGCDTWVETITGNVWKAYGDRKFTNNYYLKHLLYPDTKLSLCFHYTVNTNTLSARYCETKGTSAVGVVGLTENCVVTDWTADKVGHDINCVGRYTVSFLNVGVGAISIGNLWRADYELRSKVILDGYDRKVGKAKMREITEVWRSGFYL